MIMTAVIAGTACALDKYLKYKAEQSEGSKELLGGSVEISKVHNRGLAFDKLQDRPTLVKWITAGAGAIAAAALLGPLWRGSVTSRIGTGLIIGGAASNISDRFTRGYVIDYIGFKKLPGKFGKVYYNLGDFALFIGAILSII